MDRVIRDHIFGFISFPILVKKDGVPSSSYQTSGPRRRVGGVTNLHGCNALPIHEGQLTFFPCLLCNKWLKIMKSEY